MDCNITTSGASTIHFHIEGYCSQNINTETWPLKYMPAQMNLTDIHKTFYPQFKKKILLFIENSLG